MSWEQYITNLTANPQIEDAAIWGSESGQESKWAGSPGLDSITADEIKKLAGNRAAFSQCGPHIAGMKCMLLTDKLDTEDLYSMNLKTAADSNGNRFPICVGKSHKAFVIAKGTKDANGGTVADQVYKTIDYLRKSKY